MTNFNFYCIIILGYRYIIKHGDKIKNMRKTILAFIIVTLAFNTGCTNSNEYEATDVYKAEHEEIVEPAKEENVNNIIEDEEVSYLTLYRLYIDVKETYESFCSLNYSSELTETTYDSIENTIRMYELHNYDNRDTMYKMLNNSLEKLNYIDSEIKATDDYYCLTKLYSNTIDMMNEWDRYKEYALRNNYDIPDNIQSKLDSALELSCKVGEIDYFDKSIDEINKLNSDVLTLVASINKDYTTLLNNSNNSNEQALILIDNKHYVY